MKILLVSDSHGYDDELKKVLEDVDVILLGPQVRFQKSAIEKLAAGRKKGPIPVEVIDMRDYGTMNGKAVFEMAKKLIGD